MQPTQSICESCQHSMMTKVEVLIQANKQDHGRIIPVGVSRETMAQPWCFRNNAGIPIQMAVVECEGYEPADAPKRLLKPGDFEAVEV